MHGRSATVGDLLRAVGCPLVEVAADAGAEAIAGLMSFAGLDAVLLVRPCGAAERIVAAGDLLRAVSSRTNSCSVRSGPGRCGVPRCAPEDPIFTVARALLDEAQAAVLVERHGERLALVTAGSLAAFLATSEFD